MPADTLMPAPHLTQTKVCAGGGSGGSQSLSLSTAAALTGQNLRGCWPGDDICPAAGPRTHAHDDDVLGLASFDQGGYALKVG